MNNNELILLDNIAYFAELSDQFEKIQTGLKLVQLYKDIKMAFTQLLLILLQAMILIKLFHMSKPIHLLWS